MLTKFAVTNFKSFKNTFVFDLSHAKNYNFNAESIEEGVVENAIVYGKNGVGKSNLGLAIFDIVGHLTEKERGDRVYSFYLNALSKEKVATFKYEFLIAGKKVVYEYKKQEHNVALYERFSIEGKVLASIDRRENNHASIDFKGAESLNKELANESLSLLKYIKNNTVLIKENLYNSIFLDFYEFIEGMLFFRSLGDNLYLGLEAGRWNVQKDIIENGNVEDFESFLNRAGIECRLKEGQEADGKILFFDFAGTSIPFGAIASQGTKALIAFYFWLQRLRKNKVNFLFIDEFDAFYYHDLSKLIVEELKKMNIQFVLTTHNTSIMTNELLRPDCYFIMNKDMIKSLNKSTEKELREAHNLEKMYKAGSFHLT